MTDDWETMVHGIGPKLANFGVSHPYEHIDLKISF